ncbi:outer membrane protein H.8 precursor [Burkholderiaceae bacterium 26]|nr:outer membrane protein H.8 precursor [Burkholderiaceae bacterium 26]
MIKPLLLAVLTALALAGCGRSDDAHKPAAPAPASAPAASAPGASNAANAPAASSAPAVSEAEQAKAVDLARAAIEKYKLTTLPQECLSFLVDRADDTHNSVEVLENHTPACGGDPNTAPRVVTLLIDKNTGALQKDDPASGEYVPLK